MTEIQAPRILVIDDDVTQRLLVKEYLEEAGYLVRLSEDGKHGLKMAATINLDLIILDVMLPSLDGYAVCTCLRQQPKTADVPIILITGSKEPNAISRGLAAGATDFITKPVEWQFLANRVNHVLEKSRRMKEMHAAKLHMEEELRATQAKEGQHVQRADAQAREVKAALEEEVRRTRLEADERVRNARAEAEAMVEAARNSCADEVRATRRAADAEVSEALSGATGSFWKFLAAVGAEQQILVRSVLERAEALGDGLAAAEGPDRLRLLAGDARRVAAAANNLHILAQHMSGAVQLKEAEFDLKALADTIVAGVRPLCAERKVAIESAIPDTVQHLFGDALRIRFLLLNLMANAMAFSVAGGTIVLEASARADEGLRIMIRDSGVGMAPAAVDKLRAALDRPASMITQKNSIGFGVPIAMAIARLHGGRLDFESALGRGTAVSLILPTSRLRHPAAQDRFGAHPRLIA